MLEVCVDSLSSVVQAARGGADRLELCAALSEGGLTPSLGLLLQAKKQSLIPVFALIRSRQGDFIYEDGEVDVMEADILMLKKHGADGFVFGCLDASGNVNKEQCARLLAAADPLPCTFHRAFDCAADPETALNHIIELGFSRLLTSGQARTATEGAALISRLVSLAGSRLVVMPGGGVTAENVASLRRRTGVVEVHASARGWRRSARPAPQGVTMGAASDEHQWLQCDPEKVSAIRKAFLQDHEG